MCIVRMDLLSWHTHTQIISFVFDVDKSVFFSVIKVHWLDSLLYVTLYCAYYWIDQPYSVAAVQLRIIAQ